MSRMWKTARWLVPGAAALALGGCASSAQWQDFFRTEVARVASDLLGSIFQLTVQATT